MQTYDDDLNRTSEFLKGETVLGNAAELKDHYEANWAAPNNASHE